MAWDEIWSTRFETRILGLSYEELVRVLCTFTLGRLRPKSPYEVEVRSDLAVVVSASPHLRLAEDADEESRTGVERLVQILDARDEIVRRCAWLIADLQRDYFRGDRAKPRQLRLEGIAAALKLPNSIVAMALRSKRVLHPRGVSSLEELLGRNEQPPEVGVPRPRPQAPRTPYTAAAVIELLEHST
jgi:hypothetical protein